MVKTDYLRGNNSGCPCQGCGDRDVGCHSECEKYKVWRKKMDEKQIAEYQKKQARNTMSSTAVRKMWRDLRYQRQQKIRRAHHG